MRSTFFRDPQARSSALAALGTLQPRAFRSLNRVDPLDSVSNYYLGLAKIIHVAATFGMVVGSELHERAVLPKDHYIIQAFINSAVSAACTL